MRRTNSLDASLRTAFTRSHGPARRGGRALHRSAAGCRCPRFERSRAGRPRPDSKGRIRRLGQRLSLRRRSSSCTQLMWAVLSRNAPRAWRRVTAWRQSVHRLHDTLGREVLEAAHAANPNLGSLEASSRPPEQRVQLGQGRRRTHAQLGPVVGEPAARKWFSGAAIAARIGAMPGECYSAVGDAGPA